MILTVTLNPSLDKNYVVADFTTTGSHRVESMFVLPSGKGLNVSRVLQQLGVTNKATGILGGQTGKKIERELKQTGVPYDFIWIRAESRCCTLILDKINETHCELIEPGPEIPQGAWRRLNDKLNKLLPGCSWVVFSGSPPPGTTPQIYYKLIKLAQEHGVKVALDTRGVWLKEGIKAAPDLIKPNWEEFQELVGPVHSTVKALERARRLVAMGVGTVVISTGSRGAIAIHDNQGYTVQRLPSIEVISPIGSGDALVAGLLAELSANNDFERALRFGLALGCSNAAHFGAGIFDMAQVEMLQEQIQLEKVPY